MHDLGGLTVHEGVHPPRQQQPHRHDDRRLDRLRGANWQHSAIGDRLVDSYEIRRNGRTVGHAHNDCTLVAGQSDAGSVGQCLATFALPHGHVTSVGTPSIGATSQLPLAGSTGCCRLSTDTATTSCAHRKATLTLRYVKTR